MHWLLDSDDPDVQGLEYVVHGSIERGNDGIFFWKKKALFMPYLIELVTTQLPEDFDEAEYLRLNPDVKASGLDGASHYRLYGQKEGRHYQPEHLREGDEKLDELRVEHQEAHKEEPQEHHFDEHTIEHPGHQSQDQGNTSAQVPPEVQVEALTEIPDQVIAENSSLENITAPNLNPAENSKPH